MSDRPSTTPDYAAEAAGLTEFLVGLRRAIHADPEVGLDTVRTQQRVIDALDGLDLEISTGERLASVTAVLRGGRPGPTVLLRGDMDGLPVQEQTDLPYASTTGTMHACGHDLHTVGVVGAAHLLAAHRADLAGNVVFMFQPGEEGDGGARLMLEEGLLDITGERPAAAYAIHVAPGPRGAFALRPGPMCAGSGRFEIVVSGRGGHGSQPHQALDPVPVAAEIVLALQTMVTRRFNAFDPVIVSVTNLDAGDGAANVIPERVRMSGTVRALTPEAVAALEEHIPRIAEHVAIAHGATATTDLEFRYPPTVNDETATAEAVAALRATFGDERVLDLPTPMMGSEDFSFVLAEVPGVFVALGTTPPDLDPRTAEFNHSPRAVFDDAVLPDQAAALATLAHARLHAVPPGA